MAPSQAECSTTGEGWLALSCSLLKFRDDSIEFSAITLGWLSRECKNLRYALRSLRRKTPGITLPFTPPLLPTELCAAPGCSCAPTKLHASCAVPALASHPRASLSRLHPAHWHRSRDRLPVRFLFSG